MGNDRAMSSFMANGDPPPPPAIGKNGIGPEGGGRANAIDLIDSTPGKTPNVSIDFARFADVSSLGERKKKRGTID